MQAVELTDEQLNKIIFTSSAGVHSGPLAEFAIFGVLAGAKDVPRLASPTGGAGVERPLDDGATGRANGACRRPWRHRLRVVELLAPSEERSWAPAGERSPWTGSMRWSIPTNLWRWLAESMP